MSRQSGTNPISLFPFLAVLVSTMGALILLLLVITRQAQQSRTAAPAGAMQPVKPPDLPPLPEPRYFPEVAPLPPLALGPLRAPRLSPLPEVANPTPALLERRKELERQLAVRMEKQARLEAADAELRMLTEKVATRQQHREALAATRQERLGALEQLQKKVEARRAEARAAAAVPPGSRYAIVAYSGPNGTRRQPIFFECQSDAIVLQPEGVRIAAALLQQPEDPQNPLALVAAAVVDALQSERPDEPPYLLFVVRPGGIAGYYLARQALAHLEAARGYELVDEPIILEYPPPSSQLRELAEAALRRARKPTGGAAAPLARSSRPAPDDPPALDAAGSAAAAPPRLLAPSLAGALGGSTAKAEPANGRRNGQGAPPPPPAFRPSPHAPMTFDEIFFAATPSGETSEPDLVLPELGERAADANWMGLPVAPRWFRREILVDCHGSNLVLGLGGETVPLGTHDDLHRALRAVLHYAKGHVDRWRRAGELHQFRPVLVFRVHPDGLENYYRLRLALMNSNLSVEHRLANAEAPEWTMQLGASHAPQYR